MDARNAPGTAAKIRENKERILKAWEQSVRQRLHGAERLSYHTLRDSFPMLLDLLVETLLRREIRPSELEDVAISHATQRSAMEDFDANQLAAEYSLLQEVIFEALAPNPVAEFDRDVVLRFIEHCRSATVRCYSSLAHRKAQEAWRILQASEERLKFALESAQVGIWDWDIKNDVLVWSEKLKRLFGIRPDQTLNGITEFFARVHPEDAKPMQEKIQLAMKRDIDLRLEFRIVLPDGTLRWMSSRGRTYFDAEGKPSRMAGTTIDITDRKAIETALKAGELRFRRIFESNVFGIVFGDSQGRIVEANDYFLNLLGYTREEFERIKPQWRDITAPEHWSAHEAAFKELHETCASARPYEQMYVRKNGERVWVLVGLSCIDESNSEFIAHVVDLTVQKAVEGALRQSIFDFRAATDSVPSLLWWSEIGGHGTHFNHRWFEYTGLTPEQSQGAGWTRAIHPDDLPGTLKAWEEGNRTGNPLSFQERVKRRDGQFRWHLVRAVPVKDAEGRVTRWYASSTDIHDQHEAIDELQKAHAERVRFVATLTHDLRTPITAARMAAQLIQRRPDQVDRVISHASRVVQNIDRTDRMIQDLLDSIQIRAGKALALNFGECDLRETTLDVIEDLSTIHGTRFVFEDPGPVRGLWACDKLRQVLVNLGENAVKYGSHVDPITFSIEQAPEQVVIKVHNRGNPIPPEQRSELFSPFHRAEEAVQSGKRGWGIGLVLVKGVVAGHGGTVEVESSEQDGTTFVIRLPRRPEQLAAAS